MAFCQAQHLPAQRGQAAVEGIEVVDQKFDLGSVELDAFDLGGEVYLNKNWGLTAYGNRDMVQEAWVIRDLGIVYRDDCTRIDVIYRREDVILGRLGPTESIAVRLTLATLGGPMYAN